MSAAGQDIWSGLTTAPPLDQVNLALGIAGVWLMIRRSLWAFPVGLAAVTVQGALFYWTRYYADATLQVLFFGALAYGWWHWVRDKGAAPELPVTRLARNGLLRTIGFAGVGTVVWALLLRKYTDAIMPFRDALIAAFSVAAQVLQARKQIENWPFWVGVNLVAVCSYWLGGLYYTAFLYAVYLSMAFAGWREWRRAMQPARA
jgi:nicotinamide mononucleotide transporter